MTFLRWMGVAVVGGVTTLSLNLVFGTVLAWVTHGDLGLVSGPYWTYSSNLVRVSLLTSLPLLAHLLGGFTSGRLCRSSSGLGGALSAVSSALLAVARGSWAILGTVLDPSVDPRTRQEILGFDLALAGTFVAYFPFTVLAGYLGGRLGGWLRSSTRF